MRLGVLACGAPLAERVGDLARAAAADGWDVTVTLTTAAQQWAMGLDVGPPTRDVDAQVVCPLTFNTANKWALGISDTPWLGVLDELLSRQTPIVAVPMVNETLWQHPAWQSTLTTLKSAGVQLLNPSTGELNAGPVTHGSGSAVAAGFEPAWVLDRLSG